MGITQFDPIRYKKEPTPDKQQSSESQGSTPAAPTSSSHTNEIDLLALLICKPSGGNSGEESHPGDLKFEFLEDQYSTSPPLGPKDQSPSSNIVQLDITNGRKAAAATNQEHLQEIINDLSSLDLVKGSSDRNDFTGQDDDVDYLELMDS